MTLRDGGMMTSESHSTNAKSCEATNNEEEEVQWQPDPGHLQQLIMMLQQSLTADTEIQRAVQEKLTQLQAVPDFSICLSCILSGLPNLDESTRMVAAVLLKNTIRNQAKVAVSDRVTTKYIKAIKRNSLLSLSDSSKRIRNCSANVVASIAQSYSLANWPELFPYLVNILEQQSSDVNLLEGALHTIALIFEDCRPQLSENQPLIQGVLEKVLAFISHLSPNVKCSAITIVNQAIVQEPYELPMLILERYVNGLFEIRLDDEAVVREKVCFGMRSLLQKHLLQYLLPNSSITAMFVYMLDRLNEDNEKVSQEACEFWLKVSELPALHESVKDILPGLVPLLIKNMRYQNISSVDVADDCNVLDKDEDIKPRFHRHSSSHGTGQASGNNGHARDSAMDGSDDDDDESLDDDDEDHVEGTNGEWNARKCAAATIDTLAVSFGPMLLDALLPELDRLLQESASSEDWAIRECVVLAIGAISEGCKAGMSRHLGQLIPFLFECIESKHALVRSITCWTLSRYAKWIVHEYAVFVDHTHPQHNPQSVTKDFLGQLVGKLLSMLKDRNKRVQEAACSAFATLEEDARFLLVPWLEDIVNTFVYCFQFYQRRNLLILYDAVGTLASNIGQFIVPYSGLIMQPLCYKWTALVGDDRQLFPLFECLSALTHAMKKSFRPFAPPIYARACSIIEHSMAQQLAFDEHPDRYDAPNMDFVVVSLDLLSGLVDSLREDIVDIVMATPAAQLEAEYAAMQIRQQSASSSGGQIQACQELPLPNRLVEMLFHCMADPTPEVRQSAFALLGDLTGSCFDQLLRPNASDILSILKHNLDIKPCPNGISVANNAIWAIGEIAYRHDPQEVAVHVPAMLGPLVMIMTSSIIPQLPKTLIENTAITLGRLGLSCPELVAPRANEFFPQFCAALALIRDNDEKDSAFHGICAMAVASPEVFLPQLPNLCAGIASFEQPRDDLRNKFAEILSLYRHQLNAEQWKQLFNILSCQAKQRLQVEYADVIGSEFLDC